MKRNTITALRLLLIALLLLGLTNLLRTRSEQRAAEQAAAAAAEAAGLDKLPLPKEESDPVAAALLATDLAALREVNPDVVGWISIPDTPVNYPLLQRDSNEYYLDRTWQGTYNPNGSIFLEKECAADLSDFNTIVYGHNMVSDAMFGTLDSYQNADYLAAHPCVYMRTDTGVWRYRVFAAYEATLQDACYRLGITTRSAKEEALRRIQSTNPLDTGLWPGFEDQILTLSTCTNTRRTRRFVVISVLEEVVAAEGAASPAGDAG